MVVLPGEVIGINLWISPRNTMGQLLSCPSLFFARDRVRSALLFCSSSRQTNITASASCSICPLSRRSASTGGRRLVLSAGRESWDSATTVILWVRARTARAREISATSSWRLARPRMVGRISCR